MKYLVGKLSRLVACMALVVTMANVNSACFFFSHQPELPKNARCLRKF